MPGHRPSYRRGAGLSPLTTHGATPRPARLQRTRLLATHGDAGLTPERFQDATFTAQPVGGIDDRRRPGVGLSGRCAALLATEPTPRSRAAARCCCRSGAYPSRRGDGTAARPLAYGQIRRTGSPAEARAVRLLPLLAPAALDQTQPHRQAHPHPTIMPTGSDAFCRPESQRGFVRDPWGARVWYRDNRRLRR